MRTRARATEVASRAGALAAGLAAIVLWLQPALALAEDAPASSRPRSPLILEPRLDPGLFVAFGQEETVRFLVDLTVALRFDLTYGTTRVSLVPEIGYAYHDGDAVGGHSGAVGLGLRIGTSWIAVNPVASVILGARADRFDIGVRAGARLLAVLDFFGLEVAYELRSATDGSDQIHALVVTTVIDLSVLLMPLTYTRLNASFRSDLRGEPAAERN